MAFVAPTSGLKISIFFFHVDVLEVNLTDAKTSVLLQTMSTGKFSKKLMSVEHIKEERSTQLVRKAVTSMREGNTALITLLEKRMYAELDTAVLQLLKLGTKDTRQCTNFQKSEYSDKCVNCGRKQRPHDEDQIVYEKALAKGEKRRELARRETKLGWNPLHFAAIGGAPENSVRMLLKLNKRWAQHRDPVYGRFPLHCAARVRFLFCPSFFLLH